MRKNRFPAQRKCKLALRGEGPFQVLERISGDAYKIDFPSEYNISSTFNFVNLSPYEAREDSRMNTLEERCDDENQVLEQKHSSNLWDPFQIASGPIIKAITKRFKEALNGVVQDLWANHNSVQSEFELKHAYTN